MSVQRLQQQLLALGSKPHLSQKEINTLRQAAGATVSPKERAIVDDFVRQHRDALEETDIRQLYKSLSRPLPTHAQLRITEEHALGSKEASGVIRTKKGWLIADDDKGLFYQTHQGETIKQIGSKHKAAQGIEGLCLSEDGKTAYTLSEDSRAVYAMPLSFDKKGHPKLGEAERLGRLPTLGDTHNKGWEGLDILPARFSADGKQHLVAIHEGEPRQIGIFALPDLTTAHLLKLPNEVKEHLADLSDIAICPKTGHLFLLSDESRTIAELAIQSRHRSAPGALLEQVELEYLGHTTLDLPKHAKPEGLSFDGEDTLWMVSDGDQRMWKIDVQR